MSLIGPISLIRRFAASPFRLFAVPGPQPRGRRRGRGRERVSIKPPGLIWLSKEDLHRGRRHHGRDLFSELYQLSALVQRDIKNFFSPTLEKGPIGLRGSLAEGDSQPSPGSEQS